MTPTNYKDVIDDSWHFILQWPIKFYVIESCASCSEAYDESFTFFFEILWLNFTESYTLAFYYMYYVGVAEQV